MPGGQIADIPFKKTHWWFLPDKSPGLSAEIFMTGIFTHLVFLLPRVCCTIPLFFSGNLAVFHGSGNVVMSHMFLQ